MPSRMFSHQQEKQASEAPRGASASSVLCGHRKRTDHLRLLPWEWLGRENAIILPIVANFVAQCLQKIIKAGNNFKNGLDQFGITDPHYRKSRHLDILMPFNQIFTDIIPMSWINKAWVAFKRVFLSVSGKTVGDAEGTPVICMVDSSPVLTACVSCYRADTKASRYDI